VYISPFLTLAVFLENSLPFATEYQNAKKRFVSIRRVREFDRSDCCVRLLWVVIASLKF